MKLSRRVETVGDVSDFVSLCTLLGVPLTTPVKATVRIGGKLRELIVDVDDDTAIPTAETALDQEMVRPG